MGGFLALAKTLFVPALISLILYVSLSYAILPFIRRHRQRYSQYLPLDRISTQTTSIRTRAADALLSFLLPASWRDPREIGGAYDGSGELFDDEEGEGMVGFDIDAARREALERDRSLAPDTTRRLSRDLEQGFMDDSEDESGEDTRIAQRGRS